MLICKYSGGTVIDSGHKKRNLGKGHLQEYGAFIKD